MDVSGKVAIVTGGGRGIGRAIALELARNGAAVAPTDINVAEAVAVAADVAAMGRASLGTAVDVTDQGSVEEMVRQVTDSLGPIDILVNNAGTIGAPGWEKGAKVGDADWELIYAVNVRGMARVIDAVTIGMMERRYGKIVNIASIAGRIGTVTNIPYGVSKAGVINLTQALALDLASFSINVNAICPGLIWSPMWQRISQRKSTDPAEFEGLSEREIFDLAVQERIPLGREQTAEDIGYLAAFLASDYAKNITGQSVNVSGGSHIN